MQVVAGSNPAVPTISSSVRDYSRPTQTYLNQGFSDETVDRVLVSSGLDQAPLGHKYVTSSCDSLKYSLEITSGFGTPECALFRKKIFSQFELVNATLSHHYLKIACQQDYVQANRSLLNISKRLHRKDLNLASSDIDLENFASAKSLAMLSYFESSEKSPFSAFEQACDQLRGYGINPPKFDDYETIDSLIQRLRSKSWWLKQLRSLRARELEAISRDLGFVSKHKSAYCSGLGYELYRNQQIKNQHLMESLIATNAQGDRFSLRELQDKSVSNPAIRRAELMVRIRGFEEVAQLYGHSAGFYTITTPSKMHAVLSKGAKNPAYNGTTPREANEYLANVWSLIRAKFARDGIKVYGFRVAEPHHDGTPHWHLLLFFASSDRKSIARIMRHYSLAEDCFERGASKYRFREELIDPEKGSAAGYIAKYISKNIDGFGVGEDLDGNDAKRSASKIRAWASTWGIRQFQQIGGPSVSVWRELRRLDSDLGSDMEKARKAADSSDWAAYVLAMGGPTLPSKERPIKAVSEPDESDCKEVLDPETGELKVAFDTRYGSHPRPRIVGLSFANSFIKTRVHKWRINFAKSEPKSQSAHFHEAREASLMQICELAPLDLCQ